MIPANRERQSCGTFVAIFSSIHFVLKAEQLLKAAAIPLDVAPVPRQISGDCGMAITFASEHLPGVKFVLAKNGISVARIFCQEEEGVFHEIFWKEQ